MREIDNYFKDFLKINGFICKKTSWYRFTQDLVQIINLQKSQYGNCYYFNLGLDIMTCEKKAYKYPPEYKFPVRLRIESVVNEESLLKSLDFENSYDSIMRTCYLNQLIEATINFFNTVMTIDDIIAAYTDPNHPLLKSLTTNEFKRYIYMKKQEEKNTENSENLSVKDEHLHFELRTQAGNMKGLSTKLNPNLIVDTKFESQNPEIKPQSNIGIIKICPDGKKEIKNPF